MPRIRIAPRCVAAASLLLAARPVPAADVLALYPYETQQAADGVYVFTEPRLHPIVSGNVTAIVGDDQVLVFDTGHHPTVSRHIIADIRRLTGKPIRYVVNSHWHDDHWAGNAEFAAAYPGVTVIAQRFTARMIEGRRDAFAGEACRRELAPELAKYREMAATHKRPDGSAMTAESVERVQAAVPEFEAESEECGRKRYRGVDLAFDHELDVRLGRRLVRLMFLGRANTAGDVVAYVPDAKLLLTGDVLVAPFPFATQSYISEWATVLRELEHMDAAVIVPGHGPVMRDKRYLTSIAELMEALSRQVRAAYQPGLSVDDVRGRVDVAEFRARLCGTDKMLQANFDYMILQSAVQRAYEEVTGTLVPEG